MAKLLPPSPTHWQYTHSPKRNTHTVESMAVLGRPCFLGIYHNHSVAETKTKILYKQMSCLTEALTNMQLFSFCFGISFPIHHAGTCTRAHSYRKNSKIWDTSNNCHNCPKIGKVWCKIALMHPKEAGAMANSIDPDQTASSEAVWSWSALFAETYLSQYIEFLR